ncbi:MAG: hypothetical protein ACLTDS_07190 [Bianqueaceae bacterium]
MYRKALFQSFQYPTASMKPTDAIAGTMVGNNLGKGSDLCPPSILADSIRIRNIHLNVRLK